MPSQRHNGWLALRLPDALAARSQETPLDLTIRIAPGTAAVPEPQSRIEIQTPAYSLTQQTDRQAGFPSRIEFPSGRVLDSITWGDRLFDRESATPDDVGKGVWGAADDRRAELAIVGDGPVCTVVRHTVHFVRPDGSVPPGKPTGVYQWVFFKLAAGLVYLEATYEQETPRPWSELHFAEMNVDDAALPEWHGSDKPAAGPAHGLVSAGKEVRAFKSWSALADGREFIAMHDPSVRLYADQENGRIYLHAAANQAWKPWNGAIVTRSTWMQVGTAPESAPDFVQAATGCLQTQYADWRNADPDWRQSAANAARCYGRNGAERQTHERESADLAVVLGCYPNGEGRSLAVDALAAKRDGALFVEQSQNLFQIEIENLADGTRYRLDSQSPWQQVDVNASDILFRHPLGVPAAGELTVRVSLAADAGRAGLRWGLAVTPGSDRWRIHSANVASLTLEAIGTRSHALFPGGEGTVVHHPNRSRTQRSSRYPSLDAAMAWMAVWDDGRAGGFYLGAHDPTGATKQLSLRNADHTSRLEMAVEHSLPFLPDSPGTTASTPGEMVWQTFDGDWYDAAKLYRDWVRREASWYPPMGPEGRRTTPLWLKQLCVWARVFGEAERVVPQAERFREVMGVPCGFHWYVWHQIPFDNDYPHYFPARPGFEDGVKAIQALGCYVMPYTNGRLWDTRDRGAEDWQFTAVGSKGVCRRADGKVVTETYRSKEEDGSKVVLGVMCPGSDVWKQKVAENDCRLINEVGLNGVYMDQIAASSPVPCENPAHGHPLGGGAWWVAGYKKMLQDIRAQIPAD
ncbi:MAG: DUF6259 domain-containing protein, partial [Lentisphaeria bacterium]|nr:DUF6259 domain-containing protein [Lentisphaeria bacterium]